MVDTMLSADVGLKFDLFGKSDLIDNIPIWTRLVQQSPYWGQLNAQGFQTYPNWVIS
jgi:hypothetical protein